MPSKQKPKSKTGAKPGPKRKKPTQKTTGIGSLFWRILLFPFRVLWGITWRAGAFVVLLGILGIGYYVLLLPDDPNELVDGRARGSVTLLDRDGKVFAWRGDQFGGTVSATTISPYLRNAVVAVEDKRFYRHFGLSPRGVASAVRINLRAGRGPLSGNGGSTITQQTAKLLCLGVPFDPNKWADEAAYERDCRSTTIWRKIKEAAFAVAMEVRYTKDEVLSIYMNRAFLGAGARGFEAAAQRYFGVSASHVDGGEAAMLAGLLKAPTRYAPTSNLQRAQDRAKVVVGLMEDQGYLTKAEADFARTKPAQLSKAAAAKAGGYFADWVMSSGPEYFTRNTTEDVIIRTTLDPKIQAAAEIAVSEIFELKVKEGSKAQAAVLVMSADGAVRAMVGGRTSQVAGAFNRATQAKRQTGSVFKPFVYATALELGYAPTDTVVDEPITLNVPGSSDWSPKNYTKKFKGRVTFDQALAESLNIPAVKISESVGRNLVVRVAQDFGIQSDLAPGPAFALGTSESTLLEMTGAYAGILNGGSSVTPYGLEELLLQGETAPLAGRAGGLGERVIDEDAARALVGMMYNVVENGTGRRARIEGLELAGKTGTTQASRDAWFIGFSADYVVGVWMGYDDNTPLKGVTGSGLPADIWRTTMDRIHIDRTRRPLPMGGDRKAVADLDPIDEQSNDAKSKEENAILDTLIGILGGN